MNDGASRLRGGRLIYAMGEATRARLDRRSSWSAASSPAGGKIIERRQLTALRIDRASSIEEPIGLVAGLDDVAVMGEPVEQRGRHLGVAEHRGPSAKVRLVVTTIEVCS
jgi:hypothetical protein